MKLDDFGWSQKDLAKAMEVTPQQITKIVSGEEGRNGSTDSNF
jgi:plasmid maintenance system antidote protein VapI